MIQKSYFIKNEFKFKYIVLFWDWHGLSCNEWDEDTLSVDWNTWVLHFDLNFIKINDFDQIKLILIEDLPSNSLSKIE